MRGRLLGNRIVASLAEVVLAGAEEHLHDLLAIADVRRFGLLQEIVERRDGAGPRVADVEEVDLSRVPQEVEHVTSWRSAKRMM